MKTHVFFYAKVIPSALCLFLLSSCYSYKPYLNGPASPSAFKDSITEGKKYELKLVGGRTVVMKVDSVASDRLVGDVSENGPKGIFRQEDFIIAYDQIESVENRKFSTWKTIAVIVIPVVVLSLFAAESLSWEN